LLNDKQLFREALSALGLGELIPENYALITGGTATLLPGGETMPLPQFLRDQLTRVPFMVVKPVDGGGGKGILRVERRAGGLLVNGTSVPDFEALAKDIPPKRTCIAVEFVQQAPYAQSIFPETTNTIRVLTMLDVTRGREPFIAIAVHRFGSMKTRPVDNWTQGGLSALIDLDTGRLGRAVAYPSSGRLDWSDAHPDTQARITGTAIPGWRKVVARLLEVAGALASRVPYVGWDIVVTRCGFQIIEGNNYSDVNLLQVHRPLLVDPRVRAFYKTYGVL
jgi:hypothetical protein